MYLYSRLKKCLCHKNVVLIHTDVCINLACFPDFIAIPFLAPDVNTDVNTLLALSCMCVTYAKETQNVLHRHQCTNVHI